MPIDPTIQFNLAEDQGEKELEGITDYNAVVGSPMYAALETRQISRMRSPLLLVTYCGHSAAKCPPLRQSFSLSNLQPLFHYTSTAMPLALALALVLTSAIVLYDTHIPIEPMTARTTSRRDETCFSPAMEVIHGSVESYVSSPCQLSRPSSSPARRLPEKRNGYSNCQKIFMVIRKTHHHCQSTATIRVLSPLSLRESSKLELNSSRFAITTVEICINDK